MKCRSAKTNLRGGGRSGVGMGFKIVGRRRVPEREASGESEICSQGEWRSTQLVGTPDGSTDQQNERSDRMSDRRSAGRRGH